VTTLNRLVINWQGGGIVGTAVTVLHWSGAEGDSPPVAAIKTAFNTFAPELPSGVTLTIPGSGDKIDDTTGDLAGVWSATGAGTVTGSGGPSSAAGVGAVIGWTTGGIVTGSHGPRKLRGRTFLVPLTSTAYGNDGLLKSTDQAACLTLATALMAAGPLAVWHRPTTASSSDGNSYGVISAKVRPKVAILTSRRD